MPKGEPTGAGSGDPHLEDGLKEFKIDELRAALVSHRGEIESQGSKIRQAEQAIANAEKYIKDIEVELERREKVEEGE